MTPVMIAGVILVLQEHDPLPFLFWSSPLALLIAAIWTWYRVRSRIVEFVVTRNGAAALSVVESLRATFEPRVQRVFDVRVHEDAVQVTVGRATYMLASAEWPAMEELALALRQAKAFYD